MELNDLKQQWHETTDLHSPLKYNIMNMIKNKSYSPLAALEAKFRKQIWALPALGVLIAIQYDKASERLKEPSILFLYVVSLILGFYFLYNYLVIKKLRQPQFSVKENIETQINKLETSFKWYRVFVTVVYMLVPIFVELTMYYNMEKGFEQWQQVNVFLRLIIYIAAFIVMYFINQSWFQLFYGQHFANLKKLAEQL